MDLWQDFLTNKGKVIHKWTHYFPIYERHFSPWRNRSMTFLEIGVSKGGSLQMWQRYFGPMAKIVGIDINPKCREHEEPGIFVRIGDQADPVFLQSLIDEFGAPDVVLDDGSHEMDHLSRTFDFLYPSLPKNGVYMVEDLHTAYWAEYGGGVDRPESFINIAKTLVDKLNADHSRGAITPDAFTRETFSMCFYDSIVVFEKGQVWRKEAPMTGGRKGGLFK
jgi:cephalosporin hydroxylase